jgi:hypothetical protein
MSIVKQAVAIVIGAVAGFLLHYLSACAGST